MGYYVLMYSGQFAIGSVTSQYSYMIEATDPVHELWLYLFFVARSSPSHPDGGDPLSEAKEGGRGTKGRGEAEKRGGTATPEYKR